MKEIEIHALAGMNEHNGEAMQGLVTSYRQLLFPGSGKTDTAEKDEMEKRKAALIRETQKAFIVKPVDISKVAKRASENPEYAKLAGRAIAEHEKERLKQLQKKARIDREREARARRKKS